VLVVELGVEHLPAAGGLHWTFGYWFLGYGRFLGFVDGFTGLFDATVG
jgi:hypothetical protein